MSVYRNLVFKGGGVRGIAYLGAISQLYEAGVMRSVERVAGTSAGAITALVCSFALPGFAAIKKIADSLEYRRVPSEGDSLPEEGETGIRAHLRARYLELGLVKNLQCSVRLVQEKGWYSSDYFYQWLKSVIADQFSVRKEAYTFADFRDRSIHKEGRRFFDLYVTGTDVTNRMVRIFSHETTPDMEVALAVRISMSIPLFFEAIEFQYPGTAAPQLYADGGIMWNYPISIFDDPVYGRHFTGEVNDETLGFFLYTSPEKTNYREVRGMVDYVGALFESLLLVQEQLTLYGSKNQARTILIDDRGIEQTKFDIETEDETYRALFDSGYAAAKAFLSTKPSWENLVHRIQSSLGWRRSRD